MKRVIWKFTLDVTRIQNILMPVGAKILCVQAKEGVGCLWAECDPDAKKKPRTIITLATGAEWPDDVLSSRLTYIGTYQQIYQQVGGVYVWHVYEA